MNGGEFDVLIFRHDGDPGWVLEVVDAAGISHFWDEPFATEQRALDEAMRAIDALGGLRGRKRKRRG